MIKNVLRIFSNVEVTLNVSSVCRFTNYVTTSVIGTLVALTLRSLTLYIYGAPILDVSRSHTTTQHSR